MGEKPTCSYLFKLDFYEFQKKQESDLRRGKEV